MANTDTTPHIALHALVAEWAGQAGLWHRGLGARAMELAELAELKLVLASLHVEAIDFTGPVVLLVVVFDFRAGHGSDLLYLTALVDWFLGSILTMTLMAKCLLVFFHHVCWSIFVSECV